MHLLTGGLVDLRPAMRSTRTAFLSRRRISCAASRPIHAYPTTPSDAVPGLQPFLKRIHHRVHSQSQTITNGSEHKTPGFGLFMRRRWTTGERTLTSFPQQKCMSFVGGSPTTSDHMAKTSNLNKIFSEPLDNGPSTRVESIMFTKLVDKARNSTNERRRWLR